MTLRAFYGCIHSDYDAVMRRMMKEELLLKYLRRFADDENYPALEQAMQAKDYTAAYLAAHTLKGLCLSLGLDAMSVPVIALSKALRAGDIKAAQAAFDEIAPHYYEVTARIAAL